MFNKDYGADPLGDGTFRMVPSGDIVSFEERCRRLPLPAISTEKRIFGLTWNQIQTMQNKNHLTK